MLAEYHHCQHLILKQLDVDPFQKKEEDSQCPQKLAYLTDILLRFNSWNLPLQGRFATVIDFMNKLRSFIIKLDPWEQNIKDGNPSMFENLDVAQVVQAHLASPQME